MFNNLIWESDWNNKASLSISTQDNGTTSLIKPNPGLTQQEVYYVNTFMHELEQYFLLYGNMHISDCRRRILPLKYGREKSPQSSYSD